MKPNIFDYATSELSQDAFLAWYFMWADNSNRFVDNDLHNNAKAFLEKYIHEALGERYQKPIEQVKAERQVKFIDILLTINGDLKVIIEDKTFTGTHGKQLQRYWDNVEGPKLGLYIKTGDESADNARRIENDNFLAIYRKELLEHLGQCDSKNEIFVSFKEHWMAIEKEAKSYKGQCKWSTINVKGFYRDLQELIPKSNWHYASNPNGGDIVFNWHWIEFNTKINEIEFEPTKIYLEFSFPCWCAKEKEVDFTKYFKLKVKIHLSCEDETDMSYTKEDLQKKRLSVKWQHLHKFNKFSTEIAHNRPKQSRVGAYMTISEVSFANLINNNLNNWNMNSLFVKLCQYEQLLDSYIKLF